MQISLEKYIPHDFDKNSRGIYELYNTHNNLTGISCDKLINMLKNNDKCELCGVECNKDSHLITKNKDTYDSESLMLVCNTCMIYKNGISIRTMCKKIDSIIDNYKIIRESNMLKFSNNESDAEENLPIELKNIVSYAEHNKTIRAKNKESCSGEGIDLIM